jgi:glycosyltransferase involved in cell wall biosynthesis
MRIAIDGSSFFRRPTGVGNYTRHLTEALLRLDKDNSYTVFGFLLTRPFNQLPSCTNLRYRFIRFIPGRIYNGLFRYNIAPPIDVLAAFKSDITFFPNFYRYPLLFAGKSIVVIHDLCFLLHPQYMENQRFTNSLRKGVPQSVRKASAVVAVSENTKRELVSHVNVDPNKITVIPNGVDLEAFKPASMQSIRVVKNKYRLPQNYILYFGTLEPRKNIPGILRAYASLPKELKHTYGLVLAGAKGWKYDEIETLYNELTAAGEHIRMPGYIDDQDLAALYSGASLFVFPSFYEGFGVPPLEAMACGVPVITANSSSLPEVVGQAGKLIDPLSVSDISAAMQEILTNQTKAHRMAELGLQQAKQYTWDKSTQQLLGLFERL